MQRRTRSRRDEWGSPVVSVETNHPDDLQLIGAAADAQSVSVSRESLIPRMSGVLE
jgi:hypothetical protein